MATTFNPQPHIDVQQLAQLFATSKYPTGHAATEAAREHVRAIYRDAGVRLPDYVLESAVMPVALAWNARAEAKRQEPCPRHEGPRAYCGCGIPLDGEERTEARYRMADYLDSMARVG